MSTAPESLTVLVYSDDPSVREQVRSALGTRPVADLPPLAYVDAATQPEVLDAVERGSVDVCVLDGEAWPAGGLGLARQLKNELRDCPPCVVITGRRDDRWLARWSQAEAVLTHPVDAFEVADAVTRLLRVRTGLLPAATGGRAH